MEYGPAQTNPLAGLPAKLPLIALLIANAMPLIGVLFFKWDAFLIVLLYWSENVAVGLYNVLKMATAQVKYPLEVVGRLFPIGFFIIHYSGFTGIHGGLILAMFKKEGNFMSGEPSWPCFLVFVQILFQTIQQAYLAIPPRARWVIAAMFVSHGISFGYNYLYKREYATVTPDQLMVQPYGRIMVMHIAIIAGGFLTMTLGSPVGLLVMLVILKTAIDVALHNRQHKGLADKPAA
jgi:hypothetical protein